MLSAHRGQRQPQALICLSHTFPKGTSQGFSLSPWQPRLTAAHSTSCSRTRSPRPCCSCLPSSCHRSWAGTGHSPPPAARRTECRQSPCRSHPGATPDTGKTPGKTPWDNCVTVLQTHTIAPKSVFLTGCNTRNPVFCLPSLLAGSMNYLRSLTIL